MERGSRDDGTGGHWLSAAGWVQSSLRRLALQSLGWGRLMLLEEG